MTRIFDALHETGVPSVHFGTGNASLLDLMRDAGSDIMSLDWRVDLDAAWARIGYDKGVQGNLDPVLLLAPWETIRDGVRDVLRRAEGRPGLKARVEDNLDEIDVRAVNAVAIGTHPDGRPIEARLGRFGPYVTCGDERAQLPEDTSPDEVTVDLALELLARPTTGRTLGTDPASGLPITAREGRYGPYVQLGPPAEDPDAKAKKFASLFSSMNLEDVTLTDALRLLSLPRTVGTDPADGTEITTQAGRFGPYVKKGSETRSLETEEQMFTISLEESLALLAQPRRRRGQEPKAPLRELGADPVTGRPIVVRDGRWGPYVTDGEVNASLRAGDTPETLTPQRASDLLAARRDAPPSAARKGSSRRRKGSPTRDG